MDWKFNSFPNWLNKIPRVLRATYASCFGISNPKEVSLPQPIINKNQESPREMEDKGLNSRGHNEEVQKQQQHHLSLLSQVQARP